LGARKTNKSNESHSEKKTEKIPIELIPQILREEGLADKSQDFFLDEEELSKLEKKWSEELKKEEISDKDIRSRVFKLEGRIEEIKDTQKEVQQLQEDLEKADEAIREIIRNHILNNNDLGNNILLGTKNFIDDVGKSGADPLAKSDDEKFDDLSKQKEKKENELEGIIRVGNLKRLELRL